ncbi:MAG TPA: hypothetical protein PLS94_05565 [Prolixibacteraceae bacterium]|nr:hypothetical protein [Prolixibacteraceae bacterium]HPR60306.1 hypothetical protein [Prolixibacteraceae bacterium]
MKNTHSHWNSNWDVIFMFGFYITGLLYSGFAFTAFRSKERTITELMIPVSAFERFLYEFIYKIVFFLLLYPSIFYVSSSMAVGFRNALAIPSKVSSATVNGISTFPFETVSFQKLTSDLEPGLFGMIFTLSVLAFVLALAGSATFRKLPLIKTIVFVGLLMLSVIGYTYLLFEKLKLDQSWMVKLEHNVSSEHGFLIGTLVFAFIGLVAMAFTYFKLKEKEAS